MTLTSLPAPRQWWAPLLAALLLVPLFAAVFTSLFSLLVPSEYFDARLWATVANGTVFILSMTAWYAAAYGLGVWLRNWSWSLICLVATIAVGLGWGLPFVVRYAPRGGQIGPEFAVIFLWIIAGVLLALVAATAAAMGTASGRRR